MSDTLSQLPPGCWICPMCGGAVAKHGLHSCPKGFRRELPTGKAAPKVSKPRRDGSHAQAALYDSLVAHYYIDFGLIAFTDNCECDPALLFVREFAWGAYIRPVRRFQADVAFPARRLLVEIEGQSHSIKSRRTNDVLKSQLASEAGFTLLRLLPIQVHSGEAVALIRRALDTHAAGAVGR